MIRTIHRVRLWLGRLILPGEIPLARIIVPAGAKFLANQVRFTNVQLVLEDGSNSKVDYCYFDMTEMVALGIDFVTVSKALWPFQTWNLQSSGFLPLVNGDRKVPGDHLGGR